MFVGGVCSIWIGNLICWEYVLEHCRFGVMESGRVPISLGGNISSMMVSVVLAKRPHLFVCWKISVNCLRLVSSA